MDVHYPRNGMLSDTYDRQTDIQTDKSAVNTRGILLVLAQQVTDTYLLTAHEMLSHSSDLLRMQNTCNQDMKEIPKYSMCLASNMSR